jgi:hypothetical protein
VLLDSIVRACQDGQPADSEDRVCAVFCDKRSSRRIDLALGETRAPPCAAGGAGEVISISGDLHSLFHLTISESGNIHVKQHSQPMGVSGVGLTTGDKYQGTGVTQQSQSINGPLPQTFTSVNNFRMIGQGPNNNFLVHDNFHVTINANGELTAIHDNFSIECR